MSRRKAYTFKESPHAPIAWKSLEAKADPDAVQERATAEFAHGQTLIAAEKLVGRRDFVAFTGLSAAIASLQGCIRRPEEKILPYTNAPEYVVPGVALNYATAIINRGESVGLLVKSHEGRPTKIEGNPDHTASVGATDAAIQAALLDLYDADRSRHVHKGEEERSWEDFEKAFQKVLSEHAANGGEGLRILSEPTRSPTVLRLREAVLRRFPKARFHVYSAIDRSHAGLGAQLAFGEDLRPSYDYSLAKVVLSLDSDFLDTEPGNVRAARDFASARKVRSTRDKMNRLYVVEPGYSVTGANADHRLALSANNVEDYLRALLGELAKRGVAVDGAGSIAKTQLPNVPKQWLTAVAQDLADSRGNNLIVVGSRQPARVHALAYAINQALGNIGRTMRFVPAVDELECSPEHGISALHSELKEGKVKTLLVLGINPAFNAPADLSFKDLLAKVKNTIHLASFHDETSAQCQWHLPLAHELESWGDQRAIDGTVAIQQPLIAPLFAGRSAIEILGMVAGETNWSGYAAVRSTYRANFVKAGKGFESSWRKSLHRGTVSDTSFSSVEPESVESLAVQFSATAKKDGTLEAVFCTDPRMDDGRHANNPWLLELPDALSKICWDNAALLSPATAKELGVSNGSMVRLESGSKNDISVTIPTWIVPGLANGSVLLPLGWGRERTGRFGKARGFNTFALRTNEAFHFDNNVKATVVSKEKKYDFAQTQEHHDMEGRPLAIDATLAEYQSKPNFAAYQSVEPQVGPLWKEKEYTGHKWGMSIDLNACTGCKRMQHRLPVRKQHRYGW